MMRVLYESQFFDVTTPREVRGPGYVIFQILSQADVNLRLLGPPPRPSWLSERLLRKLYRRLTGRRYLRFSLSQAARVSATLTEAAESWTPDVVLTMFPAALWRYRSRAPVVYRVDTTYEALAREYPDYGYSRFMARVAARFQARACHRSTLLATHSGWSQGCLEREYRIQGEKVRVFPNTGGLPARALANAGRTRHELTPPLDLLLVGLDPHRKGLDIALETVRILNASGIEARLRVCGLSGKDNAVVHFVGPYDKSRPADLAAYTRLYQEADVLLHPTRFDPSPMVVAEAAAFALPTVTNDVAGMSASVLDGCTGVVLAPRSPAEAYARTLTELVKEPDRYSRLCQRARERYERELAWDRFGENLLTTLEEAALSIR